MPPHPMPRNRGVPQGIFILAATLSLAGCGLLQPGERSASNSAPRADAFQSVIASHLDLMARLSQGSPAEQAEIFQAARSAAETTPTTSNRLRYALALATPGHGAANLDAARQQLAELLATPESLLPAERALALICLKNVEQRLILQTENQKLQSDAARAERERNAASTRRLQTEIEENTRLRKELEEAQAKLDEITRIERSLTQRKSDNSTR
jgi:hypothetical protein